MDTILSFLRNLEANNNKPWFDAHKSEYQEARAHFNAIVERLIEGVMEFDPSVKGVGIKESTYRIHKDMRFSKDGLPYRNIPASMEWMYILLRNLSVTATQLNRYVS